MERAFRYNQDGSQTLLLTSRETLDRRVIQQLGAGEVIAHYNTLADSTTSKGRLIVTERANPGLSETRYVVHWQNAQTGGLNHGHYTDDVRDAFRDFSERLARWADHNRFIQERPTFPALGTIDARV